MWTDKLTISGGEPPSESCHEVFCGRDGGCRCGRRTLVLTAAAAVRECKAATAVQVMVMTAETVMEGPGMERGRDLVLVGLKGLGRSPVARGPVRFSRGGERGRTGGW